MENVPEQQHDIETPTPANKPNWLIIGLVATLFILTGVVAFIFGQAPKPKAAATPTPIASASPAPIGTNPASATGTPAADSYNSWSTYTSTIEPSLSFRYPSDWKLARTVNPLDSTQTKAVGASSFDSVKLTGPGGTVIQYLPLIDGLGGGCDKDQTTYVYSAATQTDGLVVNGVRDTYASSGAYGEEIYGVTATDQTKTSHSMPVGAVTETCFNTTYFLFGSHISGQDRQMWFTTHGSKVSTQDLDSVKLILRSLKYN